MATLGDDMGGWLVNWQDNPLVLVVGVLFLFVVVTCALVFSAHALRKVID